VKRLFVTVFAACALMAGSDLAWAQQTGAPTGYLQVWNLNTHNMGNHPGFNYRDFVAYITDPNRHYFPDVVTLQEVGRPDVENDDCWSFVLELEARTGGQDYGCIEAHLRGGAAIAYRIDRLTYQTHQRFTTYKRIDGKCIFDPQADPWTALALRLKDKLAPATAQKFVNVASLHLDDTCTWDTMKLVNAKLNSIGTAQMRVMAGDWNQRAAIPDDGSGSFTDWECWYKGTNVNLTPAACGPSLQWKEPLYRLCAQTNSERSAIYTCLDRGHWSHRTANTPRIDYLFVKALSIQNQVTVDYDDADESAGQPRSDTEDYSMHRGEGALLQYNN
jgi:hypothetical protein